MQRMTATPNRCLRIADELWTAARDKACAEGTGIQAVVVRALREYAGQRAAEPDRITRLERQVLELVRFREQVDGLALDDLAGKVATLEEMAIRAGAQF